MPFGPVHQDCKTLSDMHQQIKHAKAPNTGRLAAYFDSQIRNGNKTMKSKLGTLQSSRLHLSVIIRATFKKKEEVTKFFFC